MATKQLNRRDFLRAAGAGAAAMSVSPLLARLAQAQDAAGDAAEKPATKAAAGKKVRAAGGAAGGPARGVANGLNTAASTGSRAATAQATGPNVIIIMCDQLRADHCAREGFPLDTMPFIDSLAAGGVWFNRAYTSAPACVPARTSMITGRYPSATHVRTNHNAPDAFYTKHLYQAFREAGYRTGLCGKNHTLVRKEDVDFWCEVAEAQAKEPDKERLAKYKEFVNAMGSQISVEPNPFPLEFQNPYRLVSEAQNFARQEKGHPFLLLLSFPEPHDPYQVPEPYYSMFPPEKLPPTASDASALAVKGFKYQWNRQSFELAYPGFAQNLPRARSNYMGMLRLIDDQVKRFVEFLDREHLRENTIIIFLADHGDYVGEYGLTRKGAGLSDCLARIPFFVTGPGLKKHAGPHDAHISIVDLMPTLCEAAGIDMPEGVQGRSLWPMLTGQEYPKEEFASAYVEQGFGGLHYTANEPLDPAKDGRTPGKSYDSLNSWTQSGTMRMLRKGDWKLIFDMQGHGELYNIVRDPAELKNLYDDPQYATVCRELLADAFAWSLRAQDPLPLPRNRYVMKKDKRNYWSPYR